MMSNITSLADYRAKRGLPEAFIDARTPLQRVLVRYKLDGERGTPSATLRMLAGSCAKAIVRWIEREGKQVDDAARFQFFAAGHRGEELLQIRVSRVGPAKGPWQSREFHLDVDSQEVVPATASRGSDEVFKPLLTLPMSTFYRLR